MPEVARLYVNGDPAHTVLAGERAPGDQSDLRAGEANSFMEPVLGSHSVLVLDGKIIVVFRQMRVKKRIAGDKDA